jgi:heptosyltransferase-2
MAAMAAISRLYVRLPNWVGDVCMSLPCLHLLLQAGPPLTLCARPWARDLLAGLPAHDFVPMRGPLREDWAAVAASRRALGRAARAARGLLIPDSLSSALAFRLAGLPCAGFRDEGRSLLLRWPVSKPDPAWHTVEAWHYLARTALQRWNLPIASDAPGPGLDLPLTAAHVAAAQTLLREQELEGRPDRPHGGRAAPWPRQGLAALRCAGARAASRGAHRGHVPARGRSRPGARQCTDGQTAAAVGIGRVRGTGCARATGGLQ